MAVDWVQSLSHPIELVKLICLFRIVAEVIEGKGKLLLEDDKAAVNVPLNRTAVQW